MSCTTFKLELSFNCIAFVSSGTGSRMTTCALANCTCINCSHGLKCLLSLFRKLVFASDSFYWRFFQRSPSPRDTTDVPIHSRNYSNHFLINGKATWATGSDAGLCSYFSLSLSASNDLSEFLYKSEASKRVTSYTKSLLKAEKQRKFTT